MAYPQYDKTIAYDNLYYEVGPYYNSEPLLGLVDINHFNDEDFMVSSRALITVRVYTSLGVLVRSTNIPAYPIVNLGPSEEAFQTNRSWSVSLVGLAPGMYYVVIEKQYNPNVYIVGQTFEIETPASSEKSILDFAFYKSDGSNATYWPTGLGDVIYGIINQTLKTISFQYPSTMNVTNLAPRIQISPWATVLPASLSPQDFTSPVVYRVTAEDESFADYTVTGTGVGEANLFLYDNIYTRVAPLKLERGDTLNWFCLLANSGSIANGGTENLTVSITNDTGSYYEQIYQGAVGVIDPYEDKEMSGTYVIESDIPLGSSIKYFIQFHLNNSLIKRYITVSDWIESSKGIVFNKPVGAFVRGTFSRSKFFTNINKDFYSLGIADGANQFYYHNDNITDGAITLYNQPFYPSIEFVVNKTAVEKIFDNMIVHMNNIGVTKIEYWTETQYAIHEWPDNPLSQEQAKPWIDPEFREDKWYFPIHNEELDDYDYIADGTQADGPSVVVVNPIPMSMRDSGTIIVNGTSLEYVAIDRQNNTFTLSQNRGFAITDGDPVLANRGNLSNTREMRGTWLKVKVTFKPYYKFTLKSVLTEFRESNI